MDALLWKGTAASVVDLHSFVTNLPVTIVRSNALGVNSRGDVVGYGFDDNGELPIQYCGSPFLNRRRLCFSQEFSSAFPSALRAATTCTASTSRRARTLGPPPNNAVEPQRGSTIVQPRWGCATNSERYTQGGARPATAYPGLRCQTPSGFSQPSPLNPRLRRSRSHATIQGSIADDRTLGPPPNNAVEPQRVPQLCNPVGVVLQIRNDAPGWRRLGDGLPWASLSNPFGVFSTQTAQPLIASVAPSCRNPSCNSTFTSFFPPKAAHLLCAIPRSATESTRILPVSAKTRIRPPCGSAAWKTMSTCSAASRKRSTCRPSFAT